MTLRVLVWNENIHESRGDAHVNELYPQGIHGAVAEGLREFLGDDAVVRTATLQDPEHGLSAEVLDNTDVLLWWCHIGHDQVSDEVVDRVYRRVHAGMGLLVLHSGHYSKIFTRLMGTTCSLKWRGDGERELVWTVDPRHPIAAGVPSPIVIPEQEMYGEFFDIPEPDELVFISNFAGGEVFRSGVTYRRGNGRVFYFSPGDQEFPVYHQPEIRRVLANGVRWAAPVVENLPLTADYHPTGWFEA
jgi:trehalose utilization protein